jgi:hypothetical protein
MWRRVTARDVQKAVELMKRGEAARWWVCDAYHLRGDEIVAKHPPYWLHGEAVPPPDNYVGHWRSYDPLEDAPDLFLKFAALDKEHDFEEEALAFSHKYGLPGGSSIKPGGRPDKVKVSEFRNEAERARSILEVYEAALNCDETFGRRLLLNLNERNNAPGEYLGDDSWMSVLRAWGFFQIVKVVGTVETLCRQGIRMYGDDLSSVVGTWQYDNLLGAMYLQMYWLMTSGGDVTRCEYCRRIISLARSHPEGRKRRRDRKFCDDACRQAHHRSKKKL